MLYLSNNIAIALLCSSNNSTVALVEIRICTTVRGALGWICLCGMQGRRVCGGCELTRIKKKDNPKIVLFVVVAGTRVELVTSGL